MAKVSQKGRAALIKSDPILGAHIERLGAYRLEVEPLDAGKDAIYTSLARSITGQQLTLKAAATIFGRLCALGDGAPPAPHIVVDMDDAVLRGVGLSGAKTRALKDLAAHVLAQTVPTAAQLPDLDDDAIIAKLSAVCGIGPWSVQMLLMFRLGRPDVLPVLDYGVRKGFQLVYGGADLPSAKTMTAQAERWRPWRTMASWYLWRVVDTP